MGPVIGISSGLADVPIAEGTLTSHYVGAGYARAVALAGGVPIVLPAVAGLEDEEAGTMIDLLDGLLLSGGTDLDPALSGGERHELTQKTDVSRDRFELALVREARARDLPTLGICRGCQLLDVAYGGSLDQHRPHSASASADIAGIRAEVTRVVLEPGSRASTVYGTSAVEVVCVHHQAVDRVGDGLVVSGRSGDGLIESLEDPRATFVLGILWHPEQMIDRDVAALHAYEALVRAADMRRRR